MSVYKRRPLINFYNLKKNSWNRRFALESRNHLHLLWVFLQNFDKERCERQNFFQMTAVWKRNIIGPLAVVRYKNFFIPCTEVRFASLLSGGFTTMAVINPPEKKLANRTSVRGLCSLEEIDRTWIWIKTLVWDLFFLLTSKGPLISECLLGV